jgi:hypothetical protein
MTTTTANSKTRLERILQNAEERFAAVLGVFDHRRNLQKQADDAADAFRRDLTEESLQRMTEARALAAGSELALGGEESATAELERTEVLNCEQTFQAINESLELRMIEIERLLYGRRERLAKALASYILRGGCPESLNAYQNPHEPLEACEALSAVREAEQIYHTVFVAQGRVRAILKNGGRVAPSISSGSAVGDTISSMIAAANLQVPSI